MNITISPNLGEKKDRVRVGRGTGSGRGCRCGKGNKGQKARAGAGPRPWFEGGQMPIYRRLSKRGFKHLSKVYFNILNLETLNFFKDGESVTIESLKKNGLIKTNDAPVKLLGNGELKVKNLKVTVDLVSAAAKTKLEALGGSVELTTSTPKE